MRRVVQAGCLAEGSRGESYLVFEHDYSMPVTPGLHFTVEVHAMSFRTAGSADTCSVSFVGAGWFYSILTT